MKCFTGPDKVYYQWIIHFNVYLKKIIQLSFLDFNLKLVAAS